MALTAIASGCSSTDASPDTSWTARPSLSAIADAGSDVQEILPDDPPEVLCVLTGPPTSAPGDVLVYKDEFDGTVVDETRWTLASGKRGPSEVINTTSPSNVVVRDGTLSVRVDRTPSDPTYSYVAGYIDSLGKFARTYGKVEFRARFPYTAGVWHAMWGRPWFESFPEIDIEILNTAAVTRSQLYFVNHWAAPPIPADDRRKFAKLDDIDLTSFHTYTVSWTPGLLEWAIDGVTKMQSDGPGVPKKPVYWIINSWVGGWGGTPPDSTKTPITFEVDYMRVYRVDGLIADPAIHIVNTATEYARKDAIRVAVANFDEACAHVEMYDGDTLVRTTSAAPYRFSLARLTPGAHKLTFVATDGARRTTTQLDVKIR